MSISYLMLYFYAEMKNRGCVLFKMTNSPISTSEIKDISTAEEVDSVFSYELTLRNQPHHKEILEIRSRNRSK